MVKARIERYTRVVGVTELARRTGYSPCNISLVLRGARVPSKPLAARLRRMGYDVGEGGKSRYEKKGGKEGARND